MTPHILIADDDPTLCRALGLAVRDLLGMKATMVSDAYEAARAVTEHRFDAVLTDILMPGDGRNLIRNVRALCPGVPVILMTALTDRYDRNHMRRPNDWRLYALHPQP
jgi:CheY-like chemotaxis protein